MRHLKIYDVLEDLVQAIPVIFDGERLEDRLGELETLKKLKNHYDGSPGNKKLTPIQLHAHYAYERALGRDDIVDLRWKADLYINAVIEEFKGVLDNV